MIATYFYEIFLPINLILHIPLKFYFRSILVDDFFFFEIFLYYRLKVWRNCDWFSLLNVTLVTTIKNTYPSTSTTKTIIKIKYDSIPKIFLYRKIASIFAVYIPSETCLKCLKNVFLIFRLRHLNRHKLPTLNENCQLYIYLKFGEN